MAKILLIEDEESLRELYRKNLMSRNYEVETANDGGDALVKLTQSKPDVIILDILMPNLNGIEVLKILKEDPKLKKIPVLMLTAVSEINKMKECLEIGAIGYITKGSSADEIVHKVNMILDMFNEGGGKDNQKGV